MFTIITKYFFVELFRRFIKILGLGFILILIFRITDNGINDNYYSIIVQSFQDLFGNIFEIFIVITILFQLTEYLHSNEILVSNFIGYNIHKIIKIFLEFALCVTILCIFIIKPFLHSITPNETKKNHTHKIIRKTDWRKINNTEYLLFYNINKNNSCFDLEIETLIFQDHDKSSKTIPMNTLHLCKDTEINIQSDVIKIKYKDIKSYYNDKTNTNLKEKNIYRVLKKNDKGRTIAIIKIFMSIFNSIMYVMTIFLINLNFDRLKKNMFIKTMSTIIICAIIKMFFEYLSDFGIQYKKFLLIHCIPTLWLTAFLIRQYQKQAA